MESVGGNAGKGGNARALCNGCVPVGCMDALCNVIVGGGGSDSADSNAKSCISDVGGGGIGTAIWGISPGVATGGSACAFCKGCASVGCINARFNALVGGGGKDSADSDAKSRISGGGGGSGGGSDGGGGGGISSWTAPKLKSAFTCKLFFCQEPFGRLMGIASLFSSGNCST